MKRRSGHAVADVASEENPSRLASRKLIDSIVTLFRGGTRPIMPPGPGPLLTSLPHIIVPRGTFKVPVPRGTL